ncbi:MAG: homoserine dehydrogenase [Oscillospiraceae bacterium]|jgi:homoserine dehydrogenase|nr:homoserine dehydrogenase [Oscillospiraceae bacterium]MDE6997244.1 homoserine dehydrogenase [Oscillospiraceae bacterium]
MANFAIMGFGTVGSGVAEVLRMNAGPIAEKLGEPLNLKYILDVRDLSATPYADMAVKDFSILENDQDLDVVVESIGGAKVALDFTRRALLAGKHVVTSNKELVASHGKELLAIAKEKNVNYLFEASVGGGIPILRPLFQCLAGNQIEEIAGILNGTTNYILTRMVKGGIPFDEALKEAQAKGYAEQNPAADVEGLDAGRKICILSNLAWGREVLPGQISVQGISGLELKDVAIASGAGYRVKLLGRAMRLADGRQAAYVAPHLVPADCPIAAVDDVFNAIMIRGNAVGDVMFYGRGAGDLPTASAVMGDVIDALQHREKRRNLGWNESAPLASFSELSMRWYLRGGFQVPENCQVLSGGAMLTGVLSARDAKALAEKLDAAALLPVLQ